jgi:hypothetical protein
MDKIDRSLTLYWPVLDRNLLLSASGQKRNVLLLCLLLVAWDKVACPLCAGPLKLQGSRAWPILPMPYTSPSKGRHICVEHDAGEPRLCRTALEKPLTKHLSLGVVRWAHCLNFLPMIRVQLLLMPDLPNSSVRCRHGVPNSACAGSRCVSNHIQDRFVKPRSADNPPPSTIMSVRIQRTSLC